MASPSTPLHDPELAERKRKLAFAKGTYGVFIGGVLFVLIIICLPLTSEAIRTIVPSMGSKLSKTAAVGTLFSGQSMGKVDGAYVAAIVIYIVVLYFWRELLSIWLDPYASTEFNDDPFKTLITIGGIVILIIDGILMYVAITSLNWGRVTFSFTALLFTGAYLVALVFASLVSLRLRKRIKKLEDEL